MVSRLSAIWLSLSGLMLRLLLMSLTISLHTDAYFTVATILWFLATFVELGAVFYAFLCGLSVLGIVHYIRKHHDDKIRIRLIYVLIIWTDVATALFLAFQPQHFNCFIRIMIITTAPLIAHFIALTHTKVTNIAFCVLTGLTLLLTGYNLWMSLSPS